MGFNDAKVNLASPLTTSTTRPPAEAGTGSDVLIMQYQVSQMSTLTHEHGCRQIHDRLRRQRTGHGRQC
jgi:hypothetical protein